MLTTRTQTRRVMVGNVPLGGGAPIAIQSMTKAPADDVSGNLAQIRAAADAGCDIMRVAIPTVAQVSAFSEMVKASPLPLVADIHFDWRIALGALEAGAAKLRLNPGNLADWEGLKLVAEAAAERGVPIRIGVNSGSVKHKSGPGDLRPIAQALAEEALGYARRFEELGCHDLVLSLKAPDPLTTIAANRAAAAAGDYPLHLGVTHAGPREESMLKSAIGVGALLADGLGDTIRLSFTGDPVAEVLGAQQLLKAAGLRQEGPTLLSCPTCGRCRTDLVAVVEEVKARLQGITAPLTVAVMGCEVNGPGEAREADVGLAAAGGRFTLFRQGQALRQVERDRAVDELLKEVQALAEAKKEL